MACLPSQAIFLVILSINRLSTIRYMILRVFISKAAEEDAHTIDPSSNSMEGISHGRPSSKVVDGLVLPSSSKAFDFSICLARVPVYFLAVSHFDHIPFPFDIHETMAAVEGTSKNVSSPDQTISLHC